MRGRHLLQVGIDEEAHRDPALVEAADGASDLLVEVLGDAGKHTRAALGTNSLPFSVTIEIAAVAVVRTR